MKKRKKDSLKFETINEVDNNLIGGFSISLSADSNEHQDLSVSNNCLGGNCTENCGYYDNIGCNYHVGCNRKK